MKTQKWILGLILVLGTMVLPGMVDFFANGMHPTGANWLSIAKVAVTVFIGYMVNPTPVQSLFGFINWQQWLHGLTTLWLSFVGTVGLNLVTNWPSGMTQWWVLISAFVSTFGTYIVTTLFTNSKGAVGANPAVK